MPATAIFEGERCASSSSNSLVEIRRPTNGRARSIGNGVLIPWVSQQNGKVSGRRKYCKSVRTEKIEIDERAKEILPPAVAVEEQQVPIGVINLLKKLLSPRKVQHSFQCTRYGRTETSGTSTEKHDLGVPHLCGICCVSAGDEAPIPSTAKRPPGTTLSGFPSPGPFRELSSGQPTRAPRTAFRLRCCC